MFTHRSVEKAGSFIDAHFAQRVPGTTATTTPEGPFITLSRESGSGGSAFARVLAMRLGQAGSDDVPWAIFDQEIVSEVLRNQHLSPHIARFLPEDKVSEIDSLIREIVGLHPNLWMLVQQTNLLLREAAKYGHAIVVGRGGRFAAASVSGGLHIRLVAPVEHRARVMAQRLGLSLHEACAYNRRVDAARRDYVRSIFEGDVSDAAGYDLIFNTGSLSLESIAEVVVPVVQARIRAARIQQSYIGN